MKKTIYVQAMELQRQVDELPPGEVTMTFMAMCIKKINERWDSRINRLARASEALYTDDKLTTESLIEGPQIFGEVVVMGFVPGLRYVDNCGRMVVSLPFVDARVLGPAIDVEASSVFAEQEMLGMVSLPLDERLSRPLHVPVESLSFMMLAA
jgi:hypothetical protein